MESRPTRAAMETFWQDWLDANREAEAKRDWGILAGHYAEDATYGWMYTPDEHFMAVGRDEIRDHALGSEMAGLDGWHYDYVATVMDETNGMVVGFWKQRSGIIDEARRGVRDPRHRRQLVRPRRGAGWRRDRLAARLVRPRAPRRTRSWRSPGRAGRRRDCWTGWRSTALAQPGHYRLADLPSSVWPPVVDA